MMGPFSQIDSYIYTLMECLYGLFNLAKNVPLCMEYVMQFAKRVKITQSHLEITLKSAPIFKILWILKIGGDFKVILNDFQVILGDL